jgi:hypothetical protein
MSDRNRVNRKLPPRSRRASKEKRKFGLQIYGMIDSLVYFSDSRVDIFFYDATLKSPRVWVTKSGTMGEGLGPVISSSVVIPN